MKLRDRARGRWPEILTALGIDEAVLNGRHHPCPGCGGTDRFRYTRDESGGYFCGDERGDGFALIQHVRGCDFAGAAKLVEDIVGKADWRPQQTTVSERIARLGKPAARSRYLQSRGLTMAPELRFARSVPYYDDGKRTGTYAAMLAPITRGGRLLALHVTYLQDGAKAPVKQPKKVLSGKPTTGGAIELWPPAEMMGVAEGIETAMSASALFGMPVWSLVSTSLMRGWVWPDIVRKVTIFADHDKNAAGQAAAWHLCHRLRMAGVAADVMLPSEPGDWNDVLLAQRAAA